MQLVDFFPPIVFKAIKKFSKPAAGIETYESISEASKASGDYNDKEIAAIVLEKTKTFIKGLNSKLDNKIIVQDLLAIQSIINIRSLNEKDLEVVELGGACGAFFSSQQWLRLENKILEVLSSILKQTMTLQFQN